MSDASFELILLTIIAALCLLLLLCAIAMVRAIDSEKGDSGE